MKSFNELYSVEHFIIRQLTGVNLNAQGSVSEPSAEYGDSFWKYVPSEELKRELSEMLVNRDLNDNEKLRGWAKKN